MSDPIKPVGSGVILALNDDFNSDMKGVAEKVVLPAVATPEATVPPLADSSEHAAVKSLRLRADFIRFSIEESIAGAAAAGAKPAASAATGVSATSATAPVTGIPPAAQGLKFSESKGASILAYDAKKGEVYRFPDGKEWRVEDVRENGKSGFRAIALKPVDKSDKRIIVAYAGTKDFRSAVADAKQQLNLRTVQYDQDAIRFANRWNNPARKGGKDVQTILTGHSLGGGLASYAAIKTGLPATAINSAPLAIKRLGRGPDGKPVDPEKFPKITQYYQKDEILTKVDERSPRHARPGTKILVAGEYLTDYKKAGFKSFAVFMKNHSILKTAPDVPAPVRIIPPAKTP